MEVIKKKTYIKLTNAEVEQVKDFIKILEGVHDAMDGRDEWGDYGEPDILAWKEMLEEAVNTHMIEMD